MMRRLRTARLILLIGAATFLLLGRGRWIHDSSDQSNWFTNIQGVLQGGHLMQDVRIHYGPLSIWILAAICRIFGVRVWIVGVSLFCIGLASALLVLENARSLLDPVEEAACAAILTVWILWMPGEANIFYPSSFAITVGLLMAMICWLLASRSLERANIAWTLAAGVAAGLAFLAKQEWGGVAALGIIAILILSRAPGFRRRIAMLTVSGAAAMTTVFAALFSCLHGESFRGMAEKNGLWPFVPVDPVLNRLFRRFQAWDRFTDVLVNAGDALLWIIVAFAIIGILFSRQRLNRRTLVSAVTVLSLGVVLIWLRWSAGAHFVPLTLCAPAVVAAAVMGFRRGQTSPSQRTGVVMGFAVSSLLLLYRVGYRAMPDEGYSAYGYLLAIPPLTLLGSGIARRGLRSLARIPATLLASGAVIGLFVFGVHRLQELQREWGSRAPIRTDRGVMWEDPKWARTLTGLIPELQATTRPGDPVFFVPGPRMLDFMLDRRLDSYYPAVIAELTPSAERELIALWEQRPPRIVVCFENAVAFYSKSVFGRDFGRDAMQWIESRYFLERRVASGDSIAYRVYLPMSSRRAPSVSISRFVPSASRVLPVLIR